MSVPYIAKRSNQSILKEISPECSLEGLMLKLKLQYFGHLMWRTDSLKRAWCWERLKLGGEGVDRGWDGWMASPTQWIWVWASSGSWWWTGKPCVLQSTGLQRVGHDWVTELNWNPLSPSQKELKVLWVHCGPVAKTLHSQGRGPRFDSWLGSWIPFATIKSSHIVIKTLHAATKAWGSQKVKFFAKKWLNVFKLAWPHLMSSQVVLVVKNLPANAGDVRDACSISGRSNSGRPPGEGHGNPLQYSCLENPMDRRAWQAAVHGIAKSQTWLKWLSMHAWPHLKLILL